MRNATTIALATVTLAIAAGVTQAAIYTICANSGATPTSTPTIEVYAGKPVNFYLFGREPKERGRSSQLPLASICRRLQVLPAA